MGDIKSLRIPDDSPEGKKVKKIEKKFNKNFTDTIKHLVMKHRL